MADPTYKKISELTELAAHPATADYFPFVDASAGATKRVTLANIDKLGVLELTDPDADMIVFWDDSAGAIDWLTAGDGLTITGGSLDVDILGIEDLTDPGADRVMFWDDSAGYLTWLTVGTGLGVSTTTLALDHLGIEDLTDPGADRIAFWDDSAAAMAWLSIGTNLTISGGTTLVADFTSDPIAEGEIEDGAVTNVKLGSDVGQWTAFTPTSSNLSSVTVNVARYAIVGKILYFYLDIDGTLGSSGYYVYVGDLPVAISSSASELSVNGHCTEDSYDKACFARKHSATSLEVLLYDASQWASGSVSVILSGFYEIT